MFVSNDYDSWRRAVPRSRARPRRRLEPVSWESGSGPDVVSEGCACWSTVYLLVFMSTDQRHCKLMGTFGPDNRGRRWFLRLKDGRLFRFAVGELTTSGI